MENLSKLGVEGYALLLNIDTSECKLLTTSDTVDTYIGLEKSLVEDTFFKYMCGECYRHEWYMHNVYILGASYKEKVSDFNRKRKKTLAYDELLEIVRSNWKEKYSNPYWKLILVYTHLAIGKASGARRIPYSSLIDMKCAVEGMPSGIDFKQPALYKSNELRTIYNRLDTIQFVPRRLATEDDTTSTTN